VRIHSGLAAAGLLAVVLAGCSSGSPKTSTTSRPATIGPTGTSVAPTTAATTSIPAPTTTAPATTAACITSDLALSVSDLGAAAGTDFKAVLFKNASARPCTLFGYPGVSFVDAGGHQIGAPVPRSTGSPSRVTVAPGATVGALLAYHDVYVSTTANCQPTTAAGLRVYPPNETVSAVVATRVMVCANATTAGTADISPVTTLANLQP
jgi:Protein of unknown function (DUF4232)